MKNNTPLMMCNFQFQKMVKLLELNKEVLMKTSNETFLHLNEDIYGLLFKKGLYLKVIDNKYQIIN